MTTLEKEELLWMLTYAAATVSSNKSPSFATYKADEAVKEFRNTSIFDIHQPPEKWDDEDVPF